MSSNICLNGNRVRIFKYFKNIEKFSLKGYGKTKIGWCYIFNRRNGMSKILFIFPNLRTHRYIPPPMNIPSISYSSLIAVLREANISYSFIDANAENLSLKEIMQRIQEINPEYVGVSSNIAFAYQSCVLVEKLG